MKESDYLRATNRVKVSMAISILRDVLPGDDCGIEDSEISSILALLTRAEENLFSSYELEEDT